ncbi:dipeptidase [Alteraurantiacibacter palmitatis]|uniref:Dipeptidase n=1 Tax=Alteraurantiacibacter palmitatis TaxID=2054628 RepID=A0ABV7E7U6_9SPHN
MILAAALGAVGALMAVPVAAQAPTAAQQARANAALDAAPVWDGHNDLPFQLRLRYRNVIGNFDFNDGTNVPPAGQNANPLQTDAPRLRQGRVGAQFWSVYVPASMPDPQAVVATIEQIDVTKRLIARYPDILAFATTADEVEAAMRRGRIASLLGAEGGSSIGNSLAVLRQMYDLGVRYLTLAHSRTLDWVDSATDTPRHGGLNEFGVQVVREMARMGMLVDLSHVSEEAMHDAMTAIGAPVIFSHSGARAVNGHARNVPDSVLERLPQEGGIVMVVGYPDYLSEVLRQHLAARAAQRAQLASLWQGQPQRAAEELAAWDAANPAPLSTIGEMADHIDHIRRVAGIDHIGIGGDYDGMPTGPVGMEDVSGYPALFAELARRGYSRADMEKIASRNMMRVLREAEAYAASQRGMAPIETPIN